MELSEHTKNILGLQLPTDPRWVDLASIRLEDILTDHAYCEQKAASSCISLIVNFHGFTDLVDTLTPVVAEEWSHFERVMEQLRKRGIPFDKPRKDEYVIQLNASIRHGGTQDQQLGERLFINALIEARSCERFRILSQEIQDESLKKFYHELMISEAGHYVNFIDLAKEYLPAEYVKQRWNEWLEIEANIITNLELRGDRVH